MSRSGLRSLTRFGLLALLVVLALAFTSSTALTMPAPDHAVWQFAGTANLDHQGTNIHGAGDVDGDGLSDVIVGLKTLAANGPGSHISARVYSGKTGLFLFELDAPPNQLFSSANVVAGLGDLTGDNKSELLVGTPGAQAANAQAKSGLVRVFSGTGVLLKQIAIANMPLEGYYGVSVASAGDANGDGKRDFIVGAPGVNAVYVYSGVWTGNPATSFPLIAVLQDRTKNISFGASVGKAGDVLNKGMDAVIVGAPNYPVPGGHSGRIYVYYVISTTGGVPPPVYTIDGEGPNDYFGADVDGGRDLDGDTRPDFMGSAIGSSADLNQQGFGYAKTFSGATGTLLRKFVSDQEGDALGFSAELSGVCTSTGKPSLVMGGPEWKDGNGSTVGRAVVFDTSNGNQVTDIPGEQLLGALGYSVGGFVDLTGDGKAEFLAGANGMDVPPALFAAGAGYVYSCVPLPRPDISAAPNPADFGNVVLGGGQDVVVQVKNTGTANLNVAGVGFVPGSSPAFSIQSGGGAFVVAVNASHDLHLHFAASAPGIKGAKVRVQSDDPDTPNYDIILTAKGVDRKIQVSPGSVNFGNVDVGDQVSTTIQVKNVGNAPLTVSSIGLAGDAVYGLSILPALPKTLLASQHFSFKVGLTMNSLGGKNGTVTVNSNDPAQPSVQVPINATGVAANLRPTAYITMEVPYNGLTVQFHGDGSSDPDGTVVSYAWEFGHDQATSNQMNPVHAFPCNVSCRYVVRLTVTDNGGKTDPTSVSITVSKRQLRSRFWGAIVQGGDNVPDGTVVQAYINNKKVAESLTQTHLGHSVFAIEVPPDIHSNGEGGKSGQTVSFRYNLANANQTGIWYSGTDQELNLTAPYYVPPLDIDWCIIAQALGWKLCDRELALPDGIYIELQEWPVPPIPDPGPLRMVGDPVKLDFQNAKTGAELTQFDTNYSIEIGYSDAELANAGVKDEGTLQLFFVNGNNQWAPAGTSTVNGGQNLVKTELNHASVFALFGESELGNRIFLPSVNQR